VGREREGERDSRESRRGGVRCPGRQVDITGDGDGDGNLRGRGEEILKKRKEKKREEETDEDQRWFKQRDGRTLCIRLYAVSCPSLSLTRTFHPPRREGR
jgi:hypothetical protein